MAYPEANRPVSLVSACMTTEGFPVLILTSVEVTHEEYDNGVHYRLAEQQLEQQGYEEPYVHFSKEEAPPYLLPAIREYLGLADDKLPQQTTS